MEAWPDALQQVLNVDSFSMRYGDTSVESDVDVGPPKKRSRYTDGVDQYACSINMSYDQQASLRSFYKTTLNNGVRTFAYDDPFTGSPAEFRFVQSPEIVPLGSGGTQFRVTMSWIKMP